jgi:hypothetical protein
VEMVGNLNDPGQRGSLPRVKRLCILEKEEKDLLTKVFRFRLIPQYSSRDIHDRAPVSAKKGPQSIFRSIPYFGEQQFIGRLIALCRDGRGSRGTLNRIGMRFREGHV